MQSAHLFERGAPVIHHQKPEAYYICLFHLGDLVALHAREDFDALGNKQFLELLAGRLPLPVMLALADGQMEADDDRPDELPAGGDDDAEVDVEHPPVAELALAIVPAAMAIGHHNVGLSPPPVTFEGMTARYDNFSHTNGILRCYVRCLNLEHRGCFRYVQTNLYNDSKELLGYLFAWAERGREPISREHHQARECSGTRARILQIRDLLP